MDGVTPGVGVPARSMFIAHNTSHDVRQPLLSISVCEQAGADCVGRWSGGMACSTCTSPPTKLTPRPGRRTSRATRHRRPTSWQVPPKLQPPAHRLETRLPLCLYAAWFPTCLGRQLRSRVHGRRRNHHWRAGDCGRLRLGQPAGRRALCGGHGPHGRHCGVGTILHHHHRRARPAPGPAALAGIRASRQTQCFMHGKHFRVRSELAGSSSPEEAVIGSGECIRHAPCEARPAQAEQRCVWERTGPSRDELVGVDHDCNDIPDAAMTLAVAALFAKGPTRIRNVYNWRVKVISISASHARASNAPCVQILLG